MSSGIIGEFVQFIPLQSPHPTVQSKPCFLHVHTFVLQFVLQLHLIIGYYCILLIWLFKPLQSDLGH